MVPLVRKSRFEEADELASDPAYRTPVSFYLTPPKEVISLSDFEELATRRLEFLKSIESLRHTEDEKFLTSMDALAIKYSFNFCSPSSSEEQQAVLRSDVISHFILRLAFSAPGNRTFFVKNECQLLNYRLRRLSSLAGTKWHKYDLGSFMREHPGLSFECANLDASMALVVDDGNWISHGYQGQYFKVPFLRAIELVASRRVYLRDGVAYVTEDKMVDLIIHNYRVYLLENMDVAFRSYRGGLDGKVLEVLNRVLDLESEVMVVLDSSGSAGKGIKAVNISDLYDDGLTRRDFPLCMRLMLKELLRSHHLKYRGRMQLGLFLKGIGLGLDQSLEFWHREIIQKYGEDGWKKKGFAYTIEHNYGKQGRRKDYTPYNCNSIIKTDRGGIGDVCGCPFRYASDQQLRDIFTDEGISRDESEIFLRMRIDGQYQSVCKRFFELTHPLKRSDLSHNFELHHPNQYYAESVKYNDFMKNSAA